MTEAMKDRSDTKHQLKCAKTYTADETSEEAREQADHTRFDRCSIARLSCAEIKRMLCSDLIRAIRECRALELRPEVNQRLEFLERRKLEQLIYILRRMFQKKEWEYLSDFVDDNRDNPVDHGSVNQGAHYR